MKKAILTSLLTVSSTFFIPIQAEHGLHLHGKHPEVIEKFIEQQKKYEKLLAQAKSLRQEAVQIEFKEATRASLYRKEASQLEKEAQRLSQEMRKLIEN